METDRAPCEEETAPLSLAYMLKEEEQVVQTWSAQDRADYESGMRDIMDRVTGLRLDSERLRAETDALWEQFITLTLERILSECLREFLDTIDGELQELDQRLVGIDCETDRLRGRLQNQRRLLWEKIAVLEPLAHRTSTHNHVNMMLSRVEGLEAYLLGKKNVTPEAYEMHYKRHTTAPGDLLYLRIRLLTTRIAITAANRSRHLSELEAGLASLLPDIEQIKADLAILLTRLDCIRDLSRYWLAYLDIATERVNS